MLERANINDIELGNLLYGNSRGEYQVPRDWQDEFVDFLVKNGFDSRGYIVDAELTSFAEEETCIDKIYMKSVLPAHYVREHGTFIKEVEEVKCYEVDGVEFGIVKDFTDEFKRREDTYYDLMAEQFEQIAGYDFDDDTFEAYLKEHESDRPIPTPRDYIELVYESSESKSSHAIFNNGTFIVRPYYWGDSESIAQLPNFVHIPSGLEISWYKYPLRNSYCNKDISFKNVEEILADCAESLNENEER